AMAKIGWTMGMVTFFPHITSPATRGEHTVNNSASEQTVQKLESVNNLQAKTEAGRIDELFSNSKKKGVTVLPEPKGRPVFMFFLAKGKHKGVNCFFDNGCSDCVMRVGVPGVEWDGAITKTGPFNMNGVGGMTTTTQDEWMVLAPLASGETQAVRCVTMDRVTSNFPRYNTEEAVAQVKAEFPDNCELQDCSVPPEIGGEIDCLLGIKYNFLSPEPVHTMVESGLCIYKSKLKSHNGAYDSIIGGSHESFAHLTSLAGGAAQLMEKFTSCLLRFSDGERPMIPANPITLEEIQQAKMNNVLLNHQEGLEELMAEDGTFEEYGVADIKDVTTCTDCGIEVSGVTNVGAHTADLIVDVSSDEDDKLKPTVKQAHVINNSNDMKKLVDAENSLLRSEYRCRSCRECRMCKDADHTEKTSLREDNEDELIKQSVTLD
ncbi:MAG: hypothetical protein GY934_21195, partial [Gammaproteobacteria bacterium]|nr:hypothetical protein [Gammaproteobacteria bacterium]